MLEDIPSLRSYFEHDAPHLSELRRNSEWLRGKANRILLDQAGEPECLYTFAKRWLCEELLFGPAVKVYRLAVEKAKRRPRLFANRLHQQLAFATYRNEEAPTRRRLDAALAILKDIKPLDDEDAEPDDVRADHAETYALTGAVHRRFWDLYGRPRYLHHALNCYRRSHLYDQQRDDANVEGYGALNAAVLLDSMAHYFESMPDDPNTDVTEMEARKESRSLRMYIVERVGKRLARPDDHQQEWLCETIAGAYLGLGLAQWADEKIERGHLTEGQTSSELLAAAKWWVEKAVQQPRPDWHREATHAQWLKVAHFNEPSAPSRAMREAYWSAAAEVINILRERCGGVRLSALDMAASARRGKVGLALSGGGFRASFYHIGVLSRLAEVDALRHIDVLSTVSGGSIVGAHYYLLVRQLLELKEIPSREDYIVLVQTLQEQFSAGVSRNLRMRGLSNLGVMLKLLFKPNYTRSNRMAELYDEELFARAENGARRRFPMDSLRIQPAGETETFSPRFSNWRRCARVPALLINATCLNTGHSWHFTANWMGEPPELIGEKVDKNERLRRVPYVKSGEYQSLSLGFAVAASACVPGIFEPLRLPGLFPGRLVRLVDGGVHDNQGVDALLGQGCDFILCSDGSGQMADEERPSHGPVGTPKRSMDILMKRVREAEHSDVAHRVSSGIQRGFFFVHLKSELPIYAVDWVDCDDRTMKEESMPSSYQISHDIQRHLSEIRTDLDAFSEVEAHALMASGYLMTRKHLEQLNLSGGETYEDCGWGGFKVDAPVDRTRWGFLRLADTMAMSSDTPDIRRKDLTKQLQAGRSLFFKLITLSPFWYSLLSLVLIVLAGAAFWAFARNYEHVWQWLATHGWHASYLAIVVSASVIFVAAAIARVRVWLFESFFSFFGAAVSNIYFLLGLNHLFLSRGKLDRLLKLK